MDLTDDSRTDLEWEPAPSPTRSYHADAHAYVRRSQPEDAPHRFQPGHPRTTPAPPSYHPEVSTPTAHPTQSSPPDVHWSQTNMKRARYATYCPSCSLPIPVGAPIVFQFQLRRFVHNDCARRSPRHPTHRPAPAPDPPQASSSVADLLAPGSPLDQLSADYRQEAVRWVQFHSALDQIPGIHTDFTTSGLKHYLTHRSSTTRAIAGITSKLKKMGEKCGFVLCNSKFQQPSLQYQLLTSHRLDIAKQRRAAGLEAATNEAIAAGEFAYGIVLSAFATVSIQRFAQLHPYHQMFLAIHAIQHAGCLRFGLFNYSDPTRGDLTYAAHDRAHVLTSTWRKTKKSNRPYGIRIPCHPDRDNPAMYTVQGHRGPVHISAGNILSWYLRSSGLADAPDDALLFPLLHRIRDRRAAYDTWLKTVYSAALPAGSSIPRRIRPHSPRAGWVTDRVRQGTPTTTLKAEGRWSDHRAMMKYARTSVRDLCTSRAHRPLNPAFKQHWPPPPPTSHHTKTR